jgi:hypothetical protein
MDTFRKNAGTTIGKLVAVDGSDDHMLQFQMPHSLA